jgi:hypothetical protein
MKKIALLIMLFPVMGKYSFAQQHATASVAANIVAPIGLIKNVDMSFGNTAVSAMSGGTIVLAPGGTRTVAGGGVTLPATAGTVAAASFTVSGVASYTFSITLPGSTVLNGPGSANMVVDNFTSFPSGSGTLNAGGMQTLVVGATLNVAPAQAAGTYTNPVGVPVTVNYN